MNHLCRAAVVSFALVCALSRTSSAQTTWYVDLGGSPPGAGTQADPYTSLQYGLAQPTTIDGDTLLVAPGTYFEHIDFLGKDVVVQSTAGAASTLLDAGLTGSVVTFVNGEGPGAVLDGFTVQKGRGTSTSGGWVDGGGIYVESASPTLKNLVVRQNAARRGGGMFLSNSSAAVTDCSITGNSDLCYGCFPQYGGGVWASGTPSFDSCTISGNGNPSEGGGVYGSGSYTGCTITGNRGYLGGGARAIGATFVACTFAQNVAASVDADPGRGGGVYGGDLVACTLASNHGGLQGGGAFEAHLVDCTLSLNTVSNPNASAWPLAVGAGAAFSVLVDCDVEDNVGGSPGPANFRASSGGGIAFSNATRCRILRNRVHATGPISGAPTAATGWGGGGAYQSTLIDCDVFENQVVTGAPFGVTPTTPAGGGLFGGSATRCRIAANVAHTGGGAADASLTHCTLSANVAHSSGGGLASIVSNAGAQNSILWHDSLPEVASIGATGVMITYSDVEGGYVGTGNFDADPLFAAAASFDFHLLAGSPCIDAGNPASPLDPDGSIADVGAYPFECGVHTYCTGKENSIGCTIAIGSSGVPSTSGADTFFVTAQNALNQKTGLLLWSRTSAATPFFNGTLCLAAPIQRTGPQNSGGTVGGPDCSGTYSFHFSQSYMAAQGIVALDTIFAQYYARDPMHPDGTAVVVSDAIAFTVCP